MKNIKFPFWLKLACILIILIALGYIAIVGEKLIVPLLFSFLFAILLLPVTNFFENKARLSRSLSSIIAVVLFIFSVSLIAYLLGSQINSLSSEWPLLKTQFAGLLHNIQTWMSATFHIKLDKQEAYINNTTNSLSESSGAIVKQTVLSLSSIILFLIFVIIYTLLILFYRKLLMQFIVGAFTQRYFGLIYEILERVKHIVRKYISGLFLEMAIVAVVACLVFWLLGIKHIFLLGLLVGVLNVVPYIGIFSALLLSVSITFATSDGKHALFVAIAIIIIHLVDSNFLMPKVVGSQVKVNPLIVIIGVVAGEMFFGISGMFLSLPYLAIAKVIFDRVEGLQSWGILLGEEEEKPKIKKRKVDIIRKKDNA